MMLDSQNFNKSSKINYNKKIILKSLENENNSDIKFNHKSK